MLYLWRRMDEEGRRRVWSLYGWFCGLMVCGSCFGVVTWAARMMQLVNRFNSDDANSRGDIVQGASLFALTHSLFAVFLVMYAIDFLCLSAARLMVLDRMSDFAAGQDVGTKKLWAAAGRITMAVVVLGNAVGLAANVAAAVHAQRAAEAASSVSALFAANSTQVANEYESLRRTEIQLAVSISAVQSFCEVAVLLLIIAAFIIAGVVCTRRVSCLQWTLHLRLLLQSGSCGGRLWLPPWLFSWLLSCAPCSPPSLPSPVSCKIRQRNVPG
jgi:hypothetical protein